MPGQRSPERDYPQWVRDLGIDCEAQVLDDSDLPPKLETLDTSPHGPNSKSFCFIKWPSSQLGVEVVEYLQLKGALSLPPIAVRNTLFQAYIDHVHSRFPLLNVSQLRRILLGGNTRDKPMSMLLFQCTMYAAAAFVDLDSLRKAGYANRRIARRCMYQKAKVGMSTRL